MIYHCDVACVRLLAFFTSVVLLLIAAYPAGRAGKSAVVEIATMVGVLVAAMIDWNIMALTF